MTAPPSWLGDVVRLGILAALAGVLTAAMVFQYAGGELPCPLCLLQRVAMFGTAFAVLQQFRHGWSARRSGFALLWSLALLIVSVRQVLLVIVPRPGHAYPGSAVLGLHMPVWSVIIALALLLASAIELMLSTREDAAPNSALARVAGWLGLLLIALCAINLVSVFLQCGFGECHTDRYKWF